MCTIAQQQVLSCTHTMCEKRGLEGPGRIYHTEFNCIYFRAGWPIVDMHLHNGTDRLRHARTHIALWFAFWHAGADLWTPKVQNHLDRAATSKTGRAFCVHVFCVRLCR